MFLQAISAAKAGVGGVWDDAGRCKIPRNSGGGGRGAGGGTRDREGANSGKVGVERGITEVIDTTDAAARGRRRTAETRQWEQEMTAQGRSTARAGQPWRRAQQKAPIGLERTRRIWRQRRNPRLQGGGGGQNDTDCNVRGIRGKRRVVRTRGRSGWQRRHLR